MDRKVVRSLFGGLVCDIGIGSLRLRGKVVEGVKTDSDGIIGNSRRDARDVKSKATRAIKRSERDERDST